MTEDNIDEDYLDDPIRLFDSEQNRVCFHVIRKEVIIEDSDDVDEIEPRIEHKESLCSYENRSSILPITFFDIDSNVELLKRCRPLTIKLVDCDKYPWYSKRHRVAKKHNEFNSDIIVLQEADCIEILSSAEKNDNENYDMILKRNTLEDISNINKEFNTMRFETEKKSVAKKANYEKDMHEEYKRNSLKNDNNIDFKKNKGVIGLKISQTNFMTDDKINNKFDRRKIKSYIYNPPNFEESYVDKINTYARLIDKACTKSENVNNKPPHTLDKDSDKYPEKDQNMDKSKLPNKSETTKLNDIRKSNLNASIQIKRRATEYDFLFSKLSQSKSSTVARILSNNDKVLPVSEKSSIQSEHLIPEKNEVTNVIVEEPQSKGITLDNNNGSTSPLLPCPSQSNKTGNPKKVTIMSDIPISSNTKQNIKKDNVCKNHLFSANRVIPHYHNESVQTKKQYIPSQIPQRVPKKSTDKNKVSQTHHEQVACKANDFKNKNQSLLKDCNNGKQNMLTDINLLDINNITYNIDSNTNQISSFNRSMPNLSKEKCIPHSNLNQKLIENKINVSKEKQSEVTISSSNETKRNNNHPVTVFNNIPVLLSRKPQCTQQNTVNQPTFPIQSIVSKRDNCQINNFIVTSEPPISMSTIHQQIQNTHQHNSYSNNINNNFHSTEGRTFLQTSANVYGHRPTLYTMSQQPWRILNRLPQHQVNPRIIQNKNVKNINNYQYPTMLGDKNNSMDSCVNQRKKPVENVISNEREASAYVNKHPYLKQSLEQPPMKMSHPETTNKILNKKLYENNNCTHRNNNTHASNADKEAMVVALLATDYVNTKISRMEENIKNKGSKESRLPIDKNTHLMQVLDQLPLKMTQSDSKNTENNPKIDQNNIISVKTVSKGYSSPILPIQPYQKTFEVLAKIKLYDLEREPTRTGTNNIIGASASPQNIRKRKIDETKPNCRKITISEYKKRKSAIETINVDDCEVNVG